MKKLLLVLLVITTLSGCKTKTIYVPTETVRTEYKDRVERESIYCYDSVFLKLQNDTIWIEKYKLLYKDRIVVDSVFVNDSVQIPYPVVEFKETNRLSSFQSFQIWCGRIVLMLLLGWLAMKYVRRYLP